MVMRHWWRLHMRRWRKAAPPPQSVHIRRWWAAAPASLLALTLAATPGWAAPDLVPDGFDPVATATTEAEVVTLITGDRVRVETLAGGRVAATVEPAERAGQPASFETIDDGSGVYVVPSDAAGLIPEVLDRELFNVTKLVEYGYTDGVPVITTAPTAPVGRTAAVHAAPGFTMSAQLSSIDGAAGVVDTDGRWWQSVHPVLAGAGLRTSAATTPKVWLDGQVEAALAESVPLIGAPAAWDAGYDGAGMTVAVLDTGIDRDHPDLVGKVVAERNFAEFSDTADDRHGHGTHVAGIVAGSGAASDGAYVGVAPGVELINAKVLDDYGNGFESDIIAGMEWAAAQGADVINMSLGGAATDGTDPMSQAVNRLTDEYDVLFVIAAGNSGAFGDYTVGAPGAAAAALTVGSVDKSEQLASTSSKGPRVGDHAIKPDVTAPGVSITAAKAEGTALGPVVGEHYTTISGTSMAAPHVAAAAAMLRQAYPELSAAEVKALLATTAVPHPNLDVYQQGGGRIDLPQALSTSVLVSPSPLDLGYFPYPQDELDPVSEQVSVTNRGDTATSLTLSLQVESRDGHAASDALSVEPTTVDLAPGGTAEVTVTLDPRELPYGLYGGYLVAEADGAVVARVPVGFLIEQESYNLTVTGIARDGRPAAGISSFDVLNVADFSILQETSIPFREGGTTTVRVPAGTYSIAGVIYTYDEPVQFTQERVFVAAPEVEVTEDVSVALDARPAVPLTVQTPGHESAPQSVTTVAYHRAATQRGAYTHSYTGPAQPEFALPTEPVTLGAFEFYSHWRLVATPLGLSVVDPVDQDLAVELMLGSPAVDGDDQLPLVYAGYGRPEDYQGVDAAGAVVLVSRGEGSFAEKEAAARAAGAEAVVVHNNVAGNFSGSAGDNAQIPIMSLSLEEGLALRELLNQGPVTVRLFGTVVSDFLYDLVLPQPGRITEDLTYVMDPEELVAVTNRFHSDVTDHTMNEVRHNWRPYELASIGFAEPMAVPGTRVDYLVGGDTRYQHQLYAEPPFTGSLMESIRYFQPGQRTEVDWFKQLLAPGTVPVARSVRDYDTLDLRIYEWTDLAGHYGTPSSEVDTTRFRLYRDGELVTEAARAWGEFPVSSEAAEYRLELEVNRDAPWWRTSTTTRTVWTLPSQRPAAGAEMLPLLNVAYDATVDLTNAAPHPRDHRGPYTLGLTVTHQAGASGGQIAGVRAWVSYDDGDTGSPGRCTAPVTASTTCGCRSPTGPVAAGSRR